MSLVGHQPSNAEPVTGRAVKTKWVVKQTKEESGHYWRYKEYMRTIRDTVYNQILRMQAVVLMLVSTYILSMAESTPMVQNKEHKSSKYSAQMKS